MPSAQNYSKTVSKEMRHIMEHAQSLVDATSGELDDRIKSARAELSKRLESIRNESVVIKDQLLDKVQAADELIHEKPYHALGGTFLAGLFLGWFMSRK